MRIGSTSWSAGGSPKSESMTTSWNGPDSIMQCGASKSASAGPHHSFPSPSLLNWHRRSQPKPATFRYMPDDTGKLKKGNFMQALESIRSEAERLLARRDLAPEIKSGLERIVALTRAKFDLGGDIE